MYEYKRLCKILWADSYSGLSALKGYGKYILWGVFWPAELPKDKLENMLDWFSGAAPRKLGQCVMATALTLKFRERNACLPLGSVRLHAHSSAVTINTVAVSSSRVRVINASWNSGSPHPCGCTGTTDWLLLRFFPPHWSVASNKGSGSNLDAGFSATNVSCVWGSPWLCWGAGDSPVTPHSGVVAARWLLCWARCWVPTRHLSCRALGHASPGCTSFSSSLTDLCAPLWDSSWWGWGASMGPAGSSGPDLYRKNLLPKGLKMSQSYKSREKSHFNLTIQHCCE